MDGCVTRPTTLCWQGVAGAVGNSKVDTCHIGEYWSVWNNRVQTAHDTKVVPLRLSVPEGRVGLVLGKPIEHMGDICDANVANGRLEIWREILWLTIHSAKKTRGFYTGKKHKLLTENWSRSSFHGHCTCHQYCARVQRSDVQIAIRN